MNRPACVVVALLLILTAARLPAADDPRIAQVRRRLAGPPGGDA